MQGYKDCDSPFGNCPRDLFIFRGPVVSVRTAFMIRTLLFLTLAVFSGLPASAAERPADVYVLSGQSNMQGIGSLAELAEEDRTPCPNVFYWNGKAFEPLVPGQTKTSTRDGEFGPEITFARAISAKAPGRDVYLIKHYVSGQPLHHGWHKDGFHDGPPAPGRLNFYPGEKSDDPNTGQHYRTLRNTFRAALEDLRRRDVKFTVRGFLWMQGEADAKHAGSATEYAASLKRLKRRLEEDLGVPALPFVFGQVLPHEPAMDRFTHRREIRESQRNADEASGHADAIPGVKMVSTDGFPLKPDTVHYTAPGLAKLGRAFAAAMLGMVKM